MWNPILETDILPKAELSLSLDGANYEPYATAVAAKSEQKISYQVSKLLLL